MLKESAFLAQGSGTEKPSALQSAKLKPADGRIVEDFTGAILNLGACRRERV